MKNIEIRTTQNVVLQYELADLRERILAFLIDLAILFFGGLMLIGVLSSVFTGTALTVMMIFVACIVFFYSLAFELMNQGQSPGKMAMRIRVIKVTSGQTTFADYAARWVFRLVDIWFSLGGIASILIASSSKSQRIGDIVANTTVIKLTPNMDLTLKDILNIHSQTSYKPEYTQAKQLAEEDVLLIKSTLSRYQKYGNEAHDEALATLADKVREILNAQQVSRGNDLIFLQTVLKDYVMLTR
jgi:uncharacterized RDD family membrane protein YckC